VYVELHAASAFSFLEAASLPELLVDRAIELGYPALALLDRDGLYGAPRFHLAAKAAPHFKAIIGAELTIRANGNAGQRTRAAQSRAPDARRGHRAGGSGRKLARETDGNPRPPHFWQLPVLVASQEGYRNLCRLITRMKLAAPKGEGSLTLDDLDGFTSGLVALAGRPALMADRHGVGGLVDRLVGLFGRTQVYVELQRHFQRGEAADNDALITLASAFRVPILATNGVRFARPDERPLFDVLTCILHKTTLAQAGQLLAPNAERYLKSPADMAALFADLPHAVTATRELADRLEYTMANLGYRFPDYPVPEGETKISFLRKITEVGARERYRPFHDPKHDRARTQLARELNLIEKLDLAGYFLIVWDIVNYCRQQGILVQGRGSAANSAVCYSLGITAVDPIAMDLLFERFLSEERGEWPDIDLDLPSGDRREQVIQHVYTRYGQLGAAMTANVISYRGRSAAREVGKVLGFDPEEVDRLAKVMHHFEWRDPHESFERNLRTVGIDPADGTVGHFAELWARIQRLPRHLGQHSGGMVICQGRLDEVAPLEPASMPGRVVIQWDKEDCADMGIVKVDLLGLGMMAVLQDALALVNGGSDCEERVPGSRLQAPGLSEPHDMTTSTRDARNSNDLSTPGARSLEPAACVPDGVLDLAHLPPDDPAVYRMLQEADTVGIFQVESRAQMATLPRLKPARFYDIVVEVAIIRPGPIVGQMVHPYLSRRAGRESVEYPHPSLEPILARTLGVPLFQEQLLRMAMVAAGFTGGEAEELRRALGFRRSEERMKRVEAKLRAGMARQGIAPHTAEAILTSITSFALYGFPESHAASFALIVYASAYLKAHYPAAFYTAMLNNQPMGFYHPATLVKDAQRRGVRFVPIDVQTSDWLCRVEPDGAIRLGLLYTQGLRAEVGKHLAARRPFRSLEQLIAATGIHRDELATLASIGALNAFGYDRRGALWQVEQAIRPRGELFEWDEEGMSTTERTSKNEGARTRADESSFASPLTPMTPLERVTADYEGSSLTIGPHPMAFRRADLARRGVLRATDLRHVRAGRRIRIAGAVITRQRPGTAKGFVFLTLEDETGIANVIVQPDLFDTYRLVIVGEPFLLVEGLMQQQDGVTSVKAERLFGLGGSGPSVESHDFH
jgi:error-prone DNA polymerase